MSTLIIIDKKSTTGLCNRHKVIPNRSYDLISTSESGKFHYISNPLYQGERDLKNAAWVAISEDECEITL